MPFNFRNISISFAKVMGSVALGLILVLTLSLWLPSTFSAYNIFGIIINALAGLMVLTYAESVKYKKAKGALTLKSIMAATFTTSLIASLLFQIWLYVELQDSSMTSSLDGVLMRSNGTLTIDGWLNIVMFIFAVSLISILISSLYILMRRIRKE